MTLFDIAYDDFKREDTTNVIAITLYTDDKQPITPNASHVWKAKVSKEDKYVGEYPVTISGNMIKLSSSNLTRLPNGDYGLELWETYSGSTTIYPSAGVMEFRVHRNANDTLGTVDPTTDINGIIDDLHKAGKNIKVVATNTLPAGSKASVTQSITNGENQLTFNIPQGIQGEKGNVGPAPTLKIGTVTKLNPDQKPTANLSGDNGAYTLNMGIPQGPKGDTNETATNALNVANGVNSKVTEIQADGGGRNLLVGSDPTVGTPSLAGVTQVDIDGVKEWRSTGNGSIYFDISLEANTTYTYSALIKADTAGGLGFLCYGHFQVRNPNAHNQADPTHEDVPSKRDYHGINVPANQWIRIYYTFTTNDLSGSTFGVFPSHVDGDVVHTVYARHLMLEKGTVAHDWQPAPEDVDANTDTKISDLQIGGINLLKDTDKMTDTTFWGLRGGRSVRATYGSLRAKETGVSLSDYNAKCTDGAPYIDYIPQVSFEQGTEYTVSFWTTIVDAPMLHLNANDSAPNTSHQHDQSQQNIPLQASGRTYNGWYQVTATFKPKVATAYLTFRVSTAWVSSFKLEKGNKATDWQPAPEDIQSEIDALKEAVKKLGGTI